jgi:hypothetical protein
MSLADSFFDSVMDTLRESDGPHARSRLMSYYGLAQQDRKLGRLTEEQFQEILAALTEARDRLEVEVAHAERRDTVPAGQ